MRSCIPFSLSSFVPRHARGTGTNEERGEEFILYKKKAHCLTMRFLISYLGIIELLERSRMDHRSLCQWCDVCGIQDQ